MTNKKALWLTGAAALIGGYFLGSFIGFPPTDDKLTSGDIKKTNIYSNQEEDPDLALLEINNRDPYLHCACIQDQNTIDLSDRLMDENRSNHITPTSRKEENKKTFYCNKQKIRNQKKYMTRYYDFEKINNHNTVEVNDIA